MLKCLIGVLGIDSGTIVVFSKQTHVSNRPRISLNELGYMPQETCLFDELTIEETLKYFAGLNNLSQENTKDRVEYLINFLDLPIKNRLVKNLSTGQKKRVSFACSLIHNPSVLILGKTIKILIVKKN